jgi:nucleoside-diphosphate-sugar epimerase
MSAQGRAVLVTGASGFIGGRLAERLAREDGLKVTGTGRKFTDAAALSAAGVELVSAELRDGDAMARLCAGKDTVFHVAAWLGRGKADEAEAHAINVDASRLIVQKAAAAGVRRVVLVSTIAVYRIPARDEVDESVELDLDQRDVYGRTKARGEVAAALAAKGAGIELAIVRPAMVYGPKSLGWTVGMLKLVQRGVPVLFGEATGYAYPVYVDDVVDMLRLCGSHPEAAGQSWNCCDAPVTWLEFFEYYGRMCGRRPRRIPLLLARALAFANETLHLGLPLSRERLRQYVRHLCFSTTKAERKLGWKVAVPIAEGMRRSEEWLRSVGRL